MRWDDLERYLEHLGCWMDDDTDWSMPIWASPQGGHAMLDQTIDNPDDNDICAVCAYLRVLPPQGMSLNNGGVSVNKTDVAIDPLEPN